MFRLLALTKVELETAQDTNVFFMQIRGLSTSDYHDIIRQNLALFPAESTFLMNYESGYLEDWTKTKKKKKC